MQKEYQKTQCRYSKSLGGGFEGMPNEVWGTTDYKDRKLPTVFCGMYDLRDYLALFRHKGKAWIFWCGGDILNLSRGFALNDGKLKWLSRILGNWWIKWILKKAEHWCENRLEADALLAQGIRAKICPSYFGEVIQPVTYEWSKSPKVYVSCGTGRQIEYGFDIVERVASQLPHITFYLYGDDWKTEQPNIVVRGRVPIEQMNEETKAMQCSLRLNHFDGFSEITAKALLRGQYAITRIKYPMIPHFETFRELIELLSSLTIMYKPCPARDYYITNLNNFPWNAKFLNK